MPKSYTTNLFTNNNQNSPFGTLANNSRARVEEGLNGRIYVVIDGVRIEADKNDLFGMNKNPIEWLDKLVKEYDERMENNKSNVSSLETLETNIKESMKKVKNAFWAILSKNNANSVSKIADATQKQEAIKLNSKFWDLRFSLTSVKNKVYSLLLDNFMTACDKAKAVNSASYVALR